MPSLQRPDSGPDSNPVPIAWCSQAPSPERAGERRKALISWSGRCDPVIDNYTAEHSRRALPLFCIQTSVVSSVTGLGRSRRRELRSTSLKWFHGRCRGRGLAETPHAASATPR